jgi:hypothetical protein
MTDDAKNAEEIAALRAEVAALKEAVKPAPARDPKADEQAAAKWADEMHQMRERRMSLATPPSVARDLTVLSDDLCQGLRRDARAPTGRPGVIPDSQQPSNVRPAGGERGSGWAHEIPLSNPPGTHLVDALCIADDVRQRAERGKGKG